MSNVQSAVPVERPVEPLSDWQEGLLPLLWGRQPDLELFGRIGTLLNVLQRTVLKSERLPPVQELQPSIERASKGNYEEAKNRLAVACDCDVWPVIGEVGMVFARYVSGHLSPQWRPASPEWRQNQQAFARALMDLLNARIAKEKANRDAQAKGQQDAPGDMARICARILPKVADLEADLKLLAQIVSRQDGIEGGAIRQNFGEPLAKLRRFVEKRIKE